MMNKKYIPLLIALLITLSTNAQRPILFMGATAHLGNGEKIDNTAISMFNGKIEMVADASMIRIDPTAFDTIYRVHGKHFYPALIVPNTDNDPVPKSDGVVVPIPILCNFASVWKITSPPSPIICVSTF